MHASVIPSPIDTKHPHNTLLPLKDTPTDTKKKILKKNIDSPYAHLKSLFKASDLVEEKPDGFRAPARNCPFPRRGSQGRRSAPEPPLPAVTPGAPRALQGRLFAAAPSEPAGGAGSPAGAKSRFPSPARRAPAGEAPPTARPATAAGRGPRASCTRYFGVPRAGEPRGWGGRVSARTSRSRPGAHASPAAAGRERREGNGRRGAGEGRRDGTRGRRRTEGGGGRGRGERARGRRGAGPAGSGGGAGTGGARGGSPRTPPPPAAETTPLRPGPGAGGAAARPRTPRRRHLGGRRHVCLLPPAAAGQERRRQRRPRHLFGEPPYLPWR